MNFTRASVGCVLYSFLFTVVEIYFNSVITIMLGSCMGENRKARCHNIVIILLVISTIVSSLEDFPIAEGAGGSFGGGDGSAGNPYVIEDVWDLQNISSNLSAHYVLKNDIDASATASWNSALSKHATPVAATM